MFLLGLAGSLHCVQMCGPLIVAIGLPMGAASRARQVGAQVAYQGGRILTYGLLGALAGSLGSGIGSLTQLAGFENGASLLAGASMLLAAVVLADLIPASRLVQIAAPSKLSRFAARCLQSPAASTKFGMGLLMGLVPCGLIYAALLKSIGTATPAAGFFSMVAFGLGTAAPLLGLGVFATSVSRWFGSRSTRLAAISVAAMGAFLVWRALLPVTFGPHLHHH